MLDHMPASGTILVVDDSPNDLELISRCFKQLKIANRIQLCSSGDDAISYLQTKELPSVVLLDLKMPGRNGFYVLRRIKTEPEWRDIVVIVLTTSYNVGDIQLAYELGANSFLTKPLDLTEFKEMIAAFNKYWIVHAQSPPKRGKIIDKPEAA